jgi:eukaryotic-like serine/threonine-protein kinase
LHVRAQRVRAARRALVIRRNDGPMTDPTLELPPPRREPAMAAVPASSSPEIAPPAVDPSAPTVPWDAAPTGHGPGASAAGPALHRVAQFVLLERLGGGGMGVVYAAFDDKLERRVAIKLVATRGGDRGHALLLREAQAQAKLTHPNVVTVYEVGTLPEGGLFIAMELVKGQTLRAWQAAPRTWRELLAVYSAAGEGLAAAHRSGIVHRDFKPDNVLVGDDGRIRVADFGLAFAADGATTAVRTPDESSTSSGGRPEAGSPEPPTVAHTVAGTPGYMAPEQLAGAAVDARSDQFGFCVALYEALHGERPYADLAFAGGAPALRRTEPDPAYPRWLWSVVMRGLAIDPDRRFASMDALLAELTRNRGRTRRRVLAAAGLAGALAITGATSAALTGGAPPPCRRATAELAGAWDEPIKQRAAAAVLGTAAPFAPTAWASTAAAFDRYAERWLGAHQAACEATHVRHVQSAELLDRRMECLAARRRSLAAAAEVMQTRPAQAVARADEIVGSLGDIDLCADSGVLLDLPGLGSGVSPADVFARARISEARRRLADGTALLVAGDVGAAKAAVAEVAALTSDLAYDPLRAEIDFLEGRTHLVLGDVARAIPEFDRAVQLAVSSHHDELPADVWLTLAQTAGSLEQRPAETELWLGQAEAWLRRLGHPNDPRRIEAERARGNLQLTAGNARDAAATLSRALEAAEARWGAHDPRLTGLLRDRALARARLRQAEPAVADAERALALAVAAWGAEYPEVARARRTLGLLYIEQLGAVDRGERELLLARELFEKQLGPDSIDVANCEQGLSQAGQFRGDYASALDHAERAERIYAARRGAEHPRRGEALLGVGVLRFMRKDFTGSLQAYEQALPILRAALGASHSAVGILISNIGESQLALGRPDAAETDFTRALAVLQSRLGPDHADLALPLKGLGLVQLGRGRPHLALAPLERALALRTRSAAASDPQELAEIRWALARALRALGRDPARACTLAEAALAAYRSLGGEWAGRVTEISRWLARQRCGEVNRP